MQEEILQLKYTIANLKAQVLQLNELLLKREFEDLAAEKAKMEENGKPD